MTDTDHGACAADQREARPDWLTMQPTEFDTALPLKQGALFPEPDKYGSAPLFGDAFGMDL